MLLPRIVAAPRTHYELAESLGLRVDPDRTIAACGFRSRRLVANGVLISDVVSHAAADRIHFIQSAWKKTDPSGSLREEAQLLRIEALARAGDRSAASALARAFLRTYPASVHADRVAALLQEPARPKAP